MAESASSSPSTLMASFAIATGTASAGTNGSRWGARSPASPRPPPATRTASMSSPSTVKRDYPDDSGHTKSLERAGASVLRGAARLAGPGRVVVTHDNATHELAAKYVIIAVGSVGKVPPIDGLAPAGYWTNVEATSTRTLPRSIVVLGAGPSGVDIAQYFARFDVRTTIVAPHEVNPTDHARNSRMVAETLRLARAPKRGIDAVEETVGLSGTSKGYIVEADLGHVAIVVDRASKIVVGAFIGGVGAGEAIHQAVLAVKLRTPIDTLAQTVNAFPTTARELGGRFASAALKLR